MSGGAGPLPRRDDEQRLREALARAPIVLMTGPRQAGKSTLARRVVEPAPANLFDRRLRQCGTRCQLDIDRLVVVHAGTHRFPLAERVEAVPAGQLLLEGVAG